MATCAECQHHADPECRRYPPTHKGFPVVREHGWCGEFTAKIITKKVPKPPPPKPEPEPKPVDVGKAPDMVKVMVKGGPIKVDLNKDHYSSRQEIMDMLDELDGKYLRRDSRDVLYAKLVATAKARESRQNL